MQIHRATSMLAAIAVAAAACTTDVSAPEPTAASTSALSTKLTFSGWAPIPGGGTTATPDAVVSFQGKVYVFAVGIGDHAHYVKTFDGTAWSGWGLVPGGGTTLVADSAVSYGGKLYLFGIGIGDHGHYVNSFDGHTWSGWGAVPGGGTTLVSDAAVTYGGKLYLFGIGIGDHAHYVKTFDGVTWSGWGSVPGGGTTLLSDAAVSYGGKLYLFGLGIGDHAHYVNAFDGTTWSGWSHVPGALTSVVPDTATAYDGKLFLFGIDASTATHQMNAFDGTSWSGWSQVPGGGTVHVADAATADAAKLYLVGVGDDHQHYIQTATSHPALPAYNHVAFTATHNSYWVKRDNVFEAEASGTQQRLLDQALFEGVRSMEIDIHRDDTTPHNFTVYHTDKPSNSFCPQLSDCFTELLAFQHALPQHDPFTIVLELKEILPEDVFGGDHTPADLDAIVESRLGPYLYRPRDLLARCGGTGTIRDCVQAHGWPSLDELRGKFLVTIIGNYNGEASGVANCIHPVLAHNRKAWVDYATGPGGASARSAFLMESPWATPYIGCQEGISQSVVDTQVVPNAPFVQLEAGSGGVQLSWVQDLLQKNVVVRADIGQNNQPTLADQSAIVAGGATLIQNDYPWWTNADTPLRPGIATVPLASADLLNEPGHRILLKQLRAGGTTNVPSIHAGRPSVRWETTVATTRPTTDGSSPNPRRPRGTGCLYASTASDQFGHFQNGIRICRGTADGHWNVSKPLGEDAVVTVEVVQNGSTTSSTFYSNDRDPWGPGELLRLDVSQTMATNACATVYSSEAVVNDVPQWHALKSRCFATTLGEQGLAARDGDVLFVGTKNAHVDAASAPNVATDDFDVPDGVNKGYGVVDLTWPRVTPPAACIPDQAGGCAIPVDRAYAPAGGHFYSTDLREASSWGFDVEIPEYFYVETTQAAGRTPFYRCYEASQNRRFYTTSATCEGYGHQESTLGFIATSQLAGTIPLYRMYSGAQNDHLYSTSWQEVQAASKQGYVYESVAGYVWPSSGLVWGGGPIP